MRPAGHELAATALTCVNYCVCVCVFPKLRNKTSNSGDKFLGWRKEVGDLQRGDDECVRS